MSVVCRVAHMDLRTIADSGQCFRMRGAGEGVFEVVAYGRRLSLRQMPEDNIEFCCDENDFQQIWKDYFDLDTDYEAVMATVDPDDGFLMEAVSYGRGMRILRQEPWETLISFIVSQRRSVPSIRTCVERLARRFGTEKRDERGSFFSFPTQYQLAGAAEEELCLCGVGYRAKYILDTARRFAVGGMNFSDMATLGDAELKKALTSLYGVGDKVADCVMLFGFHRMDAFPVDVWIDRVIKRHYQGGFPAARYGGSAGVMQQYLFNYIRSLPKKGGENSAAT